jgi:hypothetical protein
MNLARNRPLICFGFFNRSTIASRAGWLIAIGLISLIPALMGNKLTSEGIPIRTSSEQSEFGGSIFTKCVPVIYPSVDKRSVSLLDGLVEHGLLKFQGFFWLNGNILSRTQDLSAAARLSLVHGQTIGVAKGAEMWLPQVHSYIVGGSLTEVSNSNLRAYHLIWPKWFKPSSTTYEHVSPLLPLPGDFGVRKGSSRCIPEQSGCESQTEREHAKEIVSSIDTAPEPPPPSAYFFGRVFSGLSAVYLAWKAVVARRKREFIEWYIFGISFLGFGIYAAYGHLITNWALAGFGY